VMRHYGRSYTVETVRFQGTPPMITALAAGELDIADLAYSSFALASECRHGRPAGDRRRNPGRR
jgi:hypothetical protein